MSRGSGFMGSGAWGLGLKNPKLNLRAFKAPVVRTPATSSCLSLRVQGPN